MRKVTRGGDTGKKAKLKNYGISSNVYLIRIQHSPNRRPFNLSFDIDIARIENNANLNRTGDLYLGDADVTTHCPTGTSAKRFAGPRLFSILGQRQDFPHVS
jgi:hypothetical protein